MGSLVGFADSVNHRYIKRPSRAGFACLPVIGKDHLACRSN